MWAFSTRVNGPEKTMTPRLSSQLNWQKGTLLSSKDWSSQLSLRHFLRRRFFAFLGEALREAAVF
jgi:hypothetical protein